MERCFTGFRYGLGCELAGFPVRGASWRSSMQMRIERSFNDYGGLARDFFKILAAKASHVYKNAGLGDASWGRNGNPSGMRLMAPTGRPYALLRPRTALPAPIVRINGSDFRRCGARRIKLVSGVLVGGLRSQKPHSAGFDFVDRADVSHTPFGSARPAFIRWPIAPSSRPRPSCLWPLTSSPKCEHPTSTVERPTEERAECLESLQSQRCCR